MSHGVKLGVVPTHCRFVGGLVPDEEGALPRNEGGQLVVLSEMQHLVEKSPVPISEVQISYFAHAAESDVDELFSGLKDLGLTVHLILMVGGVDPMDPASEDEFVAMLKTGLQAAGRHSIRQVASTSFEEWMQTEAPRKEGAELEAAVAQLAGAHARALVEAGVEIDAWHLEFLRSGEFQTFTDIGRAWQVVQAANVAAGKPIFRVLVDAAHCGDSALTVEENASVIADIAAAGELGIFHASAPTTRGCLSSDDGWIAALLAACARTGALRMCMVELFHHEDDALVPLRELVAGHGVDTTLGRSYSECVIDGLKEVERRLSQCDARGLLGK